jgi:hypothetical protein
MDRVFLELATPPLRYEKLPITGWPDLDPATVVLELEEQFLRCGLSPVQGVIEKVMAVQTILKTHAPFDDAHIFTKVAVALGGHEPMFGYLEVPRVAEMTLAAQVMTKLRPDESFGVEVKRFFRAAMREEGVADYSKAMAPLKLTKVECVGPECDAVRAEISEGKSEMAKVQAEKMRDVEDYVTEHLK